MRTSAYKCSGITLLLSYALSRLARTTIPTACCVAASPPGPLAIAYAYYDKDAPTDVTPLLATHPEYDNHVRALVVEAWR